MRTKHLTLMAAIGLALAACDERTGEADIDGAEAAPAATSAADAAADAPTGDNPLLAEWTGPYDGVPAFDQMQLEHLEPAMEAAMAAHLAELEEIAGQQAAPTFENTIVAMERAGELWNRVTPYYGIWASNLSTPEFREVQQRLAPKIADYQTKISQNRALFERIKAVRDSDELAQRSPAERRLVDLLYDSFALYGAELEGEAAERYAAINQRLAELNTEFSNNVLADEENYVTYLSEDQLGGLPETFVKSAAAATAERGREGEYAVLNTRSSMDPFLTYSTERELREKVWRTYYDRGDNADPYDNNAIIQEILALRQERSELLGFDNFAEWQLSNRMAQTPERAMDLMMQVWPAALARVEEEVADMQAIADAEGEDITIQPWDYRYYAEKVRQAKYDLDSNEVKQYLQLDKLREAMFYVAGELFDFEFKPVPEGSVPVFHPDVRVWEVTDRDSGDMVGLWYLDPFARTGKRSGAWASTYRGHDTLDGKQPVLSSNNSNFVKGAPGEPVLISWDDANTYFHEFGHALHYLASNVEYPTLNSGVRDYTEFQSQLLERWLTTDPVIENYLVHYETGAPIPDELVAKIKRADDFNEGFATTEYLASAIVDLKLHMADPEGLDPDAFERETLEELGMPDEIVMRHRTPHFSHIFSGESYAAGYYGYIWAEVLTADAAEAFAEAPGGFYDPGVAQQLVDYLFAPRNALDPADAYRQFRGRDAAVDALLRDRGFPVPSEG